MHISHHTGTAAHISNFAVIASIIILKVKRSIQKTEIGEQALCTAFHCFPKKVVIGIAFGIIDAVFYLKNLHWENRCLAGTKSRLGCFEQVFHDHPPFGTCIRSVIQAGERYLCTCAGIHGIEVMDQGFHCLISRPIRIG